MDRETEHLFFVAISADPCVLMSSIGAKPFMEILRTGFFPSFSSVINSHSILLPRLGSLGAFHRSTFESFAAREFHTLE